MGYFDQKKPQVHPEGQAENDRKSENNSSLPVIWLQLMIWLLQPICWVLPIMVTIGFWTTIYNPEDYNKHLLPITFPTTCLLNGANVVLAIIDVAVIAIPVHATHFLCLVWYALLYAIVSYVNHVLNKFTGHDNDHPLDYINTLDWKHKPGAAFLASFVLLIAIFLFYWLYVVYALRLLIVSYFKKNTYEEHVYDSEGHNFSHCAHDHALMTTAAHTNTPLPLRKDKRIRILKVEFQKFQGHRLIFHPNVNLRKEAKV